MEPMSRRAQRSNQQPAGESARPARRSRARGRVAKALLLGGVVALAAKPEVRNRLLDALFGPEEQFEYDSVTKPAATPIIPDHGADGADAATGEVTMAQRNGPGRLLGTMPRRAAAARRSRGLRMAHEGSGALHEPSGPAFESPDAPSAMEPPMEQPTVVYEAWSSSGEGGAVRENEPTVVHEPWSASAEPAAPVVEPTVATEHSSWSGEAIAVPEGEPTVVHETWSGSADAAAVPRASRRWSMRRGRGARTPRRARRRATVVHETWSGSADAAAVPEGEPTVVHEPSSPGGEDVGAPEGEPTVVFEPWLRSGEDVGAPEGERTVVDEPWTPSEPGAAAGEEEPS